MDKDEFYREARADLPGPLAGVRVLEVTTTWAGPMCGAVLADLGADVVKVEIPSGDVGRAISPMLPDTDVSFFHATVNRNKRALTLDLRQDEGREVFLKLAAEADEKIRTFLAYRSADGTDRRLLPVRSSRADSIQSRSSLEADLRKLPAAASPRRDRPDTVSSCRTGRCRESLSGLQTPLLRRAGCCPIAAAPPALRVT